MSAPVRTGASGAGAVAGVGVALGRRALVIKDLAEGRLVAPFRKALPVNGRFRSICQKGIETRPQIDAFKSWVLQEIAKLSDTARSFDLLEHAP